MSILNYFGPKPSNACLTNNIHKMVEEWCKEQIENEIVKKCGAHTGPGDRQATHQHTHHSSGLAANKNFDYRKQLNNTFNSDCTFNNGQARVIQRV